MKQKIYYASEHYTEIDQYLLENNIRCCLLVCDHSFPFLTIHKYFDELAKRIKVKIIKYNQFQSNPLYENVVEGVDIFLDNYCDGIIAVGGGSTIDIAKCIKLYSNMDKKINYLVQSIIPNKIPILAIPTTAGSGSEATKYAVIYYKGEKQSIMDESCIPDMVLMDGSTLKTLPLYQKKSTMLDALCHCIESFWSVNSTAQSKKYSKEAIEEILLNMERYLNNKEDVSTTMLMAAYKAGKAINITQTTAGHAMCYKLTSLYGIAHGHAAALCVRVLWPWMFNNLDKCADARGSDYLKKMFEELAFAMGCKTSEEAVRKFNSIVENLKFPMPKVGKTDYEILKTCVNPVRLKNNPIILEENDINTLYHEIFEGKL